MLEKEKGVILLVYTFKGIMQGWKRWYQLAHYSDHPLELVELVTQRMNGQVNRLPTLYEDHNRAFHRYQLINTPWGTVWSECSIPDCPEVLSEELWMVRGPYWETHMLSEILLTKPPSIPRTPRGSLDYPWNLFIGLNFCKIRSKVKQTKKTTKNPSSP